MGLVNLLHGLFAPPQHIQCPLRWQLLGSTGHLKAAGWPFEHQASGSSLRAAALARTRMSSFKWALTWE